jgi:hypothetical protein
MVSKSEFLRFVLQRFLIMFHLGSLRQKLQFLQKNHSKYYEKLFDKVRTSAHFKQEKPLISTQLIDNQKKIEYEILYISFLYLAPDSLWKKLYGNLIIK